MHVEDVDQFAFTFDAAGRLVSGEAGASSVTTYKIQPGGTLSDPKSQSDGQVALCWILQVRGYYFVSNTGSNNLSSFQIDSSGQPTLLAAVAATTNPGPIDLAASDVCTPRPERTAPSTNSPSRATERSSR
jgi:hypothetical protein